MKLRTDYTISLMALSVLLFYSLCIPFSQYIPFGIAITVFICISKKVSTVDSTAFTVALFSASYFMLESFMKYSLINRLLFGLSIMCVYILGFNWFRIINRIDEGAYEIERTLSKALTVIYYGFAFYLISSFIFTVISGKIINSFSRDFYVIWNGNYGNPTHYETISCLPLGYGVYHLIDNKGRKSRLLDILILTIIIIANAMMSNRATFVCVLLFLGVSVFVNNVGKSFSRSTRVTLEVVALLLILYSIWTNNIFGVQELTRNIPVIQRVNQLNLHGYEDPRIDRQIYIITHFFDHTTGGGYFNNVIGECHNVWLDVYDYAGFIPFVLFGILTIDVVFCLFKLLRSNKCKEIVITIASIFVAFSFEPVIRSVPNLFILYFLIIGMTRYLSRCMYRKERNSV